MELFGDLFRIEGFAASAADMRALTEEEIIDYQISNLARSQQAKPNAGYWMLMSNYRPQYEKPLDERFADFKVRLAQALAKRP